MNEENIAQNKTPDDKSGSDRSRLREDLPKKETKDKTELKKMFRKLVKAYLMPYKGKIILLVAVIVLGSVLGMLPTILTKRIVDDALVGRDTQMLIQLVILSLLLLFGREAVSLVEGYLNSWISKEVAKDMKQDMFDHLVDMDYNFYSSHNKGEIMTHMTQDVEATSRTISGVIQQLLSNIATLGTTVVAMVSMNWLVAVIGFAMVPLMALPSKFIANKQKELLRESKIMNDRQNQVVTDVLSEQGSYLLKQNNFEEYVKERFHILLSEKFGIDIKEEVSGMALRTSFSIITGIAPLAIYLVGGLMLVTIPEVNLTVGTITAMVALLNRLFRPVRSLMMFGVSMNKTTVSLGRVFDYLDTPVTMISGEDSKKPDIIGEPIRFDHVDFGYEPQVQVLTDIVQEVKPGETVAIIGPVGAGKTSLVSLIPRLYDVSAGSIRIGDTDIRDIDLHYLRGKIGFARQQGYCFPETIRNNLIVAAPDATQEEIERISKLVGFHDLVMTQPDGYDTLVGPGHVVLSAGQVEQIELIRALLKNPSILVLDEATEEMDAAEENNVVDHLIDHMKSRILILVTQKAEVAKKADRILVMKEGRIIDSGTYDELSGTPVFMELFNI